MAHSLAIFALLAAQHQWLDRKPEQLCMVSFSLETSSHGPGVLNEKPAVHSPIISSTCDLRGTFRNQRSDFNLEHRKKFLFHHCFGPFLLLPCHPPWNHSEYEKHLLENKANALQNTQPFLVCFYLGAFNIWVVGFFSSFHFNMRRGGTGRKKKKSGVFWSLWLYMDFISFVCSTAKLSLCLNR